MKTHYSTIDKLQCTRCGKDITGWNKEDFLEHLNVHLRIEIWQKYPELIIIKDEIEKEYGAKLKIEFD